MKLFKDHNVCKKSGNRLRQSHKATRRRRGGSNHLGVESLENRLLLDASINMVDGTIIVEGTPDDDVIAIRYSRPNRAHVKVNTAGSVVQRAFNVDPLTASVRVSGLEGDDYIVNLIDLPLSASGGDGDDEIRGGSGDDSIAGGPGNDKLFGFSRDDTIYGGPGQDTLFGGVGNDYLLGNTDSDLIYGQAGHDEVHGDDGTFFTGFPNQSIGNDTLWGGSGADRLSGNNGNDIIRGQSGNDFLDGEAGNDRIFGHGGADEAFGGSGDDLILGHDGDDLLVGFQGNDRIYGGNGNDTIGGSSGNDFIRGNKGNDDLNGGFDDDRLFGDQGTDTIDGSTGNDRLDGGISRDRRDGGDVLTGGTGNDMIVGYYGDDFLYGGEGNDTLHGNQGQDRLEAGDGSDVLLGHGGADVLLGGPGNDRLDGSSGNDRLDGEAGSDRLDGRGGDDTLRGGEGNDRLFGDHPKDKVGGNDELYGDSGNDFLGGYAANDRVFGGIGIDRLYGHAGNDYLEDALDLGDILRGGPGSDTIQFEFEQGQLHAGVAEDGTALRLAGTDRMFPGTGFTLFANSGTWRTQRLADNSYRHSTTGEVYLDLDNDAMLNLNRDMILSLTGFSIDTLPARSVDAAVVDPESLNFSLPGSVLDPFLDSVRSSIGIGIELPDFRFGIASGRTLMSRDGSLPLRESQPYLHFSIQSGLSLSFGGVELASETVDSYLPRGSFQIIIDPTDPFLLVKSTAGDFGAAVGVSSGGRIPFRPLVELERWNNEISGHLFLELEGIPLPKGFSADGALLVDFDANDDGIAARELSNSTSQFAPGGSFFDQLGQSLDDVSIGVNGKLFFGDFGRFFKSGFLNSFFKEIDLSLELGTGSIVLDGERDEIHFKGEKSNPFAGTPLEKLEFLNQRIELSASVTQISTNPQFNMDWYQGNSGIVARSAELHLSNSGVSFHGMQTILGQGVFVSGGISSTGIITFSGSARFSIGVQSDDVGEVGAGLSIQINARASLTDLSLRATGQLTAWANALVYPLGLKTGFAASVDLRGVIELGVARTSFSLDARADFTLYVLGLPLTVSPSFSVSVGPDGFSFGVLGQRVNVDW